MNLDVMQNLDPQHTFEACSHWWTTNNWPVRGGNNHGYCKVGRGNYYKMLLFDSYYWEKDIKKGIMLK